MIHLQYLINNQTSNYWQSCHVSHLKPMRNIIPSLEKIYTVKDLQYRFDFLSKNLGIHFYVPRRVKLVSLARFNYETRFFTMWFQGIGDEVDNVAASNKFEVFTCDNVKFVHTDFDECMRECDKLNSSRRYRAGIYRTYNDHMKILSKNLQGISCFLRCSEKAGLI